MFGYLAAESLRPRRADGDYFREPSDGTIRYRPWGAVPANPFADEALKERQHLIETEFQKLFDRPPHGTPLGFATMFATDHAIGEERRKMKNFEGFMEWNGRREPVDHVLHEKINLIERGAGDAGDALDFAIDTTVQNFEVGKVTHPYGIRLEHVQPFREEVEEALTERGGVVYPKVLAYHSISIVPDVEYLKDGTHILNGFIVRYKRDFGAIDTADGMARINLTERQLAGIRIDAESGFNQDIRARMLATNISPERSWQKRYMEYVVETGARGFIERAIQLDSAEMFFVPGSTNIYVYKELYATKTTQGLARVALGPDEDDGIAYFGPTHAMSKVPMESLLHQEKSA
jgi:hypothetical protein